MSRVSEHIPPGTMALWAGGAGQYSASDIPAPGWLYCDGRVLNASDYPALYANISTRYNIGGESAGTFRIPGQGGYMTKGGGGAASRNTGGAVPSLHSHTAGVVTNTNFNTLPNANNTHSHAINSNTTSDGGNHSHGNNAGCSNNTAGNVNRAAGNANAHLQGHSHNVGTNSSAAGTHNHNGSYNKAFSTFDDITHGHSSPNVSSSGNANFPNAAATQPTFAIWHIIKT